jgi:hypothetical protein
MTLQIATLYDASANVRPGDPLDTLRYLRKSSFTGKARLQSTVADRGNRGFADSIRAGESKDLKKNEILLSPSPPLGKSLLLARRSKDSTDIG